MLLKKAVERGLTPYQIGCMMLRKDSKPEEKAPIEVIIEEAQQAESEAFMERVSILMDREILRIGTDENLSCRMQNL
jgi:hypothetical protein